MHTHVLEVGKRLGYFEEKAKGVCHGFSVRWLEACLAGEEDEKKFLARSEKIKEYYQLGEAFPEKITTLKKKIIASKKPPTEEDLNQEEQEIFDILAFYESLALYHQPGDYPLFTEGLVQGEIEQISPIAASDSILKKGGLQQVYSQAMILSSTEMIKYFDEMAAFLDKNLNPEQTVGFMLGNYNHAIALTYQQGKGWRFMDINQYPPQAVKNDTNLLTTHIRLAFNFSYHTPFNVKLFTTGDHANLAQFKGQFAAFKSAHNLSAEMIQRTGADAIDLAYIAAQDGDTDTLLKLGEAGANFNKTYGKDKLNLAWLAAQNGHTEVLKILSNYQVDLHKARDNNGMTPMHAAALNGKCEAIRILQQQGVPLNVKDKDGLTPAHIAAFGGQDKALDTLKQLGADLNEPDASGMTPLHYAALGNQVHVIVKLLSDNNVDPNKRSNDGRHAIHDAADVGSETILDLFKEKGVDLLLEDDDGQTIAHILAGKGHKEFIEKFMAQGIDFNKKNKNGLTPLHVAAQSGQLEVIEFLAAKGFDLNAEDNQGQNIAHMAALTNQAHLIPALAAKGVNMTKKDKCGHTPLGLATGYGSKETFLELVKHEVVSNDTYLFAILRDQPTIVETLLELNINFKDEAWRLSSENQFSSENQLRKLIAPHLTPGEAIPPKIEARIKTFLEQKANKENIPISPYELAFLAGKEEIVQLFNRQDPKTTELLTSLQALRKYGETIKNKNKENKKQEQEKGMQNATDKNTLEGEKAMAAADALENLACLYFAAKNALNPDDKAIETIQNSFKQQLVQTYQDLSTHRARWKPILANILIAATGLGLLVIVGKLLITGSAFFAETRRQKMVGQVAGEFDKLLNTKPM
ncbi:MULTISPECIES: ankyrin repeat domain-containing protein [Legionella]|nr:MULTISPECIES: ankyrin repeat domain-containing protein [Legionella]MCP0913426.1 ankyrin repeat domain-containing protein [Legionella sp. 27cVA30]RUR09838.1 ankyrin repeat domain-containing protein [Legionella septentrionalis]